MTLHDDSETESVRMLHVSGPAHVGKARFLQEICQFFLTHGMFKLIIMYEDLSKIQTFIQLNELLERILDEMKELHSILEVSNQAQQNHQILMAFSKADKMNKEFRLWRKLEDYLSDLC